MNRKRLTQSAIIAVVMVGGSSCGTVKNEIIYRGNYYWGHEVETFHPCGSTKAFWLAGSDSVLQPLRDEVTRRSAKVGEPYQPLYIEISATLQAKQLDGFAADYDGVYQIRAVEKVSAVIPLNCGTGLLKSGKEGSE